MSNPKWIQTNCEEVLACPWLRKPARREGWGGLCALPIRLISCDAAKTSRRLEEQIAFVLEQAFRVTANNGRYRAHRGQPTRDLAEASFDCYWPDAGEDLAAP